MLRCLLQYLSNRFIGITRGPSAWRNASRVAPVALLLAPCHAEPAERPAAGLIYHPEADAIAIANGTRWDNRPLYCHERFSYYWAGEMPGLRGEAGIFRFGFERDGQRVMLDQFPERKMRYRPGWIEWECRDPRFPGLTLSLAATTLADANGITARIASKGSRPGDKCLWACFPPNADKGSSYRWQHDTRGFRLEAEPARELGSAAVGFSAAPQVWETIPFADVGTPEKAAKAQPGVLAGTGIVAMVFLSDMSPQTMAAIADENDAAGYAKLVLRKKPLDPAMIADPVKAFQQGIARARDFSRRLIIDTPDPYLNAGAPMAVAATAGIFVNPTFVHGGSHWRQQQPGWRTMGGAIYFGWPDQVQRAVEFWGNLQVKQDDGQHQHAEYSANGCQQAGKSRFFGKGFIDYKQPPHYEFQTQFFDEAIRAWRASADPKLEKTLRPMLELHLERAKDCYDPDGDGLYESYNNTWPNDSIWFNGGGTPEQSGYIYYGHLAAADMARRAGDRTAAARHEATAARIKRAVNQLLWMPDRGQYASYIEPWGHKRQMPDAWVYAQHVPIESGLASPEQAWKAMFYTEWAMERFKLPYGGEMRQTSNFVPGQWSIRELYHGDNFGMSLGYFLGGQGDEGWNLLRGTMLESMYGDGVRKSGYSNESGGFNNVNRISPGGLSHPNCAVDFADIVSAYSRALVEGLFGYRPDYPNGIVRMEPAFPASWDHASVKTPDFAFEFKGTTYKLALTKAAKVSFGIPVRAGKVNRVTVNGSPVKFSIEPWAGYGMLRVGLPETKQAVLVVETEGDSADLPVLSREDPTGRPGHRLEIAAVGGDVPRFQLTKVHGPDPAYPKLLREAPADATWRTVDLSTIFNGDLRDIFKQRYDSPRPDRVSMRIGYDGWSAWTFVHWGIRTPEISMEKVLVPESVAFDATDPAIANPIKALTVEAWLTPDTMPADGGRIIDRSVPHTLDGFLLDTFPGNSLRLITSNGEVTAPQALTPGKTVHVAGIYDSTARVMKLYVNGREVAGKADGAFPAIKPVAHSVRIGHGGPGTASFRGRIHRVAIHDRALAPAELAARLKPDAPIAGPADWTLDGNPAGLKRHNLDHDSGTDLIQGEHLVTPQHARFLKARPGTNIAFTSLWDNWPKSVTAPVHAKGDSVWLLVSGSTTPMQGKIANAVIRFIYADGVEETLDLVPPENFWSLCGFGRVDYNYERDGFSLPKIPPAQVQLGTNCRAMVYGWKLRPGVELKEIALETLSLDVVTGLMGVSVANPE
ncbi:MAG: hypothetical protein J0M04_03945 [Verrucomicrobia bacterium]|nr:hypothetical protein [Verrucomicrobiota bacterium]